MAFDFKKILAWPGNTWLKVRLRYWIKWSRKACVRDKTIYYILLNPSNRDVKVVNSNEYAKMSRGLKKQTKNQCRLSHFIYAKADPFK